MTYRSIGQVGVGGTSGVTTLHDKEIGIAFNAHNSVTTYVNSGNVYPLSLALNYIIKA